MSDVTRDDILELLAEADHDRPRLPPLNSPGEALTRHLDLLRWVSSQHGLDHASLVANRLTDDRDHWGKVMQGMTVDTLNANSTTYLSPDIMSLVRALADTPLGDAHLHPLDLPDGAGVVLFPYAFPVGLFDPDDPLNDYVRIAGFTYRRFYADGRLDVTCVDGTPAEYRLDIIGATDLDDIASINTMAAARIAQARQNDGGVLISVLLSAQDYLLTHESWENIGRPVLLPQAALAIPFGPNTDWTGAEGNGHVRCLVTALFRMIWQRIVPRDPWRPDRASVRRAHRARPLLDGEAIKVVHLRRYVPSGNREPSVGGDQFRRAACVVRGHVRDQWYPSLGPARLPDGSWNPASHRRIWVDAHVRGDGVPVLKHAATAIVR